MMSPFWQSVHEARAELSHDVAESDFQPKNGDCYITSVKSRIANTNAGVVSLASIKLAGQRVAEGSHRLSTEAEVKDYLAQQRKAAEAVRSAELAKRSTIAFATGVK